MRPPAETTRRGGPPKRVARHIQKLVGPAARKRGFAESEILTRWAEIMGPEFSARSAPEALKFSKGASMEATLIIRTDGSTALELQHLESLILERINTYYGYRAVAKIRYRHDYIGDATSEGAGNKPPEHRPTPDELSALDARLEGIVSPDLKTSLRKIGDAILRRKSP